jgi:hypothetical protein
MTWLQKHTKSILFDKEITLKCTQMDDIGNELDIILHIKAIELNYGPVLNLTITASIPYMKDTFEDHPFMFVSPDHLEEGQIGEIIDDTPAIRSLIEELCAEPCRLYTGTWEDHCKRIIKSLTFFWS